MKPKPSGSPFLVVSYYTENTPYEQEADILRGSLHQFGYDHEIVTRPNLGSWVANTCQKAVVIQAAWSQSNVPIVWIDADAIVQKKLTLLETLAELRHDFAAVFSSKPNPRKRIAIDAATMFFHKTENAKKLIDLFELNCRAQNDWDQVFLYDAFYAVPELSAYKLPITYKKRVGKDGYADDEAHILHTRASTRLKGIINNPQQGAGQ